jgi:hypothetical protein
MNHKKRSFKMKQLFNSAGRVFALALLSGLIIAFVLSVRQGIFASPGDRQAQLEGYPGENEINSEQEALIAYPAPILLDNSNNEAENTCADKGEWITYSNPADGYSLQYPAESKLRESGAHISILLQPQCYGQRCGGSNRIVIGIIENPKRLPIEEFVEQEFQLTSAPPHKDSLHNFQSSKSLVEIAETQALRIEDGITFNKPDIFIPHEEIVVWIYVAKASNMPPYEPPCTQTLKLLDGILASMELFPP